MTRIENIPKAVLIRATDCSNMDGAAFHDCTRRFLFESKGISGLLNRQCWIDIANPRLLISTSDAENLAMVRSSDSMDIASSKSGWASEIGQPLIYSEGEQIVPGDRIAPDGAGGLLLAAINIDSEVEADFNAWYDTEHLPAQSSVPGTLCARRFRSDVGTHRYIALYHLATPEVVDSLEWKKGRNSPWAEKLRPYYRGNARIIARRYVRTEGVLAVTRV